MKKKRDYTKEAAYQKKRSGYRAALNREARKRKIYGKRKAMGMDLSHTKSGGLVLESVKKNRGRNGQNGKSTKK